MKKLLLILILLGSGYILYGYKTAGSLKTVPDSLNVRNDPLQNNLKAARMLNKDNFTISKHAEFQLQAVVLSKKSYGYDEGSALSPVDLALGWGPMSNGAVINKITFSQSNRFYYYRYRLPPPIPKRSIRENSANMHMIPANDNVAAILDRVKTGDLISLSGYLVDVRRDDGWHWTSSRTRKDQGNGACELIWVESLVIEDFI